MFCAAPCSIDTRGRRSNMPMVVVNKVQRTPVRRVTIHTTASPVRSVSPRVSPEPSSSHLRELSPLLRRASSAPLETVVLLKEDVEFSLPVVPSLLVQDEIPERSLLESGLKVVGDLGSGSQSTVQIVRRMSDAEYHTVKRFDKETMTSTGMKFLHSEYELMAKLGQHPNIAEAYDLFQDQHFFYIEMPFYIGGDFSHLRENALSAQGSLTEMWWGSIFRQCLEALVFLHAHGIVHCDVKEPNLMLKTKNSCRPEVVLIDFGVAQEKASADKTVIYGTPGYIAPEVWDVKTWCPKGDMFSLGVVFMQLLIDRVPSSSSRCGLFTENTKNFREVREATQTRQIPFYCISPTYSHLRGFVEQLLERDPELRPTATDLLCDSWFFSLDDADTCSRSNAQGRDRGLTCQDLYLELGSQPHSPHGSTPSAASTIVGSSIHSNASSFSNLSLFSYSSECGVD